MMDEDIMKAIEEVAQNATQDREHMEKEAFIHKVAMDTAFWFANHLYDAPLILTPAMRPQIEIWASQNRQRLALQIEQVVRIILHKELFGK